MDCAHFRDVSPFFVTDIIIVIIFINHRFLPIIIVNFYFTVGKSYSIPLVGRY